MKIKLYPHLCAFIKTLDAHPVGAVIFLLICMTLTSGFAVWCITGR